MKKINVQSLPIKEVLKDLAEQLDTKIEAKCHEHILNIPKIYGEGYIRGMNFKSGIGVIEYCCQFKRDTQIHFSLSEVHPLKFLICGEGFINHQLETSQEKTQILKFQNVIVSSNETHGHVLEFKKNENVHLNSIEVNRDVFLKKYACEVESWEHPLKEIFNDIDANKVFFYHGNYSVSIANTIQEMNMESNSNFMRELKLESYALQLLIQQAEQLEDDLKADNDKTVLRKQEIENISNLISKIEQEIHFPHTVKSLSQHVGLNENKLQNGFKHLYNETVNNYIQKLRMQKAVELILNTDLSMQEITEKIGLSNASYFSKVFKKEYYITPNDFRKANLKHKE